MNFASLGLSDPLVSVVSELGYTTPSPIQVESIPAILQGSDVMAAAQTGTGKTAGFTLPLLERLSKGSPARANQVRSLILTPTRELAAQVADSVSRYGRNLSLSSAVVFGGVKINPQMMKLRRGADVLVATPGRLLDLVRQNAVRFDNLEILVLDEADRMLDMGFIRDIRQILNVLPRKRQTLMFSATFSGEIKKLASGILNKPVAISVSPNNAAAQSVIQLLHPVDQARKSALLKHLLFENNWSQVLVFTRTKHGANRLAAFLEKEGVPAAAIHGNKSQGARTRALSDFKNRKTSVLVATDIAARGLDIDQLPQVVNFDLPNVPEDYVHRIGRTGRAGASGHAVSLVSADEIAHLSQIEKLLGQAIERRLVSGFEAKTPLPKLAPGEVLKVSMRPGRNAAKPKAGASRKASPNSRRRNSGAKNSSGNKRAQTR